MNLSFRGVALVAMTLLVLGLMTAPAFAGDTSTSPVCLGMTFFQSIAGDRARMVQLSVVFVLIGIALLFKK